MLTPIGWRRAGSHTLRLALAVVLVAIWLGGSLAPARAIELTPPGLVALLEAGDRVDLAVAQVQRYGLIATGAIPELGAILVEAPDPRRPLPNVPGVVRWEYTTTFTVDSMPTAAPGAWPLDLIRAGNLPPTAGQGATVGIVDTGVADHPALRSQLLEGWDAVTDRPYRGADGDPSQHGTHVAGIAASNGRDAPRGVAPGSRILPVRVFPPGRTSTSSWEVTKGIVWATDHGAQVINLSLGSASPAPDHMERAVGRAREKGVVVVASAGNCGRACSRTWPAMLASLGVAAVDRDGKRASFSAVGDMVSIAAPGVEIVSTIPGGTASFSGTSMAAPFVTGAAAVVRGMAPKLSGEEVAKVLRRSAQGAGEGARDPEYGAGILDVAAAVRLAGGNAPQPGPTAGPPAQPGPTVAPPAPTPAPPTPPPPGPSLGERLGRLFRDLGDALRRLLG